MRATENALLWSAARVMIAAVIIVAVAELSNRTPRYAALLLSLPVVSVLALVFGWLQHRDMPSNSKLAQETVVLVVLGLPLLVPLALAERLRLGFWQALGLGAALSLLSIGAWLYFGPRR